MITVIIFILILGLLIFVHEFGHFICARLRGVTVKEFGFGFPPRIFGIQKNQETKKFKLTLGRLPEEKKEKQSRQLEQSSRTEKLQQTEQLQHFQQLEHPTIYSVNWIPLGGFVKIYGEEGEGRGDKTSFISKKIWERALILSAGVLMNFLLGAVLLSLGYVIGLPTAETPENQALLKDVAVQITMVSKDSPAEKAGLEMGMKVLGAETLTGESREFKEVKDLQDFIAAHKGEKVILKLKYNQKELKKELTPRASHPEDEGPLGVALVKAGILKYPWYKASYYGSRDAVYLISAVCQGFYLLLKNLILHGTLIFDVSGPVGIAKFTGKMVDLGLIYLIQFAALLSINLGVINFIPFPALDGGRILFLIIEKIKGSPVSQKAENYVHAAGFVLLICLMVVITARDIIHLF